MSESTKNLLSITESILSETPPVKEVAFKGDSIVDDGLKAVVVPDAFVNQIMGFNSALRESSDPDKKQEMMPKFEPITEASIIKERMEKLIENLKQLLKEAKEVIKEATTCGALGTVQGNSLKSPSRGDASYPPVYNGSNKVNKGNKGNKSTRFRSR